MDHVGHTTGNTHKIFAIRRRLLTSSDVHQNATNQEPKWVSLRPCTKLNEVPKSMNWHEDIDCKLGFICVGLCILEVEDCSDGIRVKCRICARSDDASWEIVIPEAKRSDMESRYKHMQKHLCAQRVIHDDPDHCMDEKCIDHTRVCRCGKHFSKKANFKRHQQKMLLKPEEEGKHGSTIGH